MRTLRPLLARTQLAEAPLRCAFDAARDGWSADAFHAGVNAYGACVLVGRTEGGAVFGGYNPRGYIGIGEDRDSAAAFLFSWPDGKTAAARPMKLQKVGGPGLAVRDDAAQGVRFGAEGLRLLQPRRERRAHSRLGTYYARMPGGGRSLFAPGEEGKDGAAVVELRAWVAKGGPEKWMLAPSAIVWRSERGSDEES